MRRQGRNDGAVASFLDGDPAVVGDVRAIMEAVITSFDFNDSDLKSDLVQDALGRMVVSLRAGRFRGDASITTYAHSIARYTCIEHLRRRRREARLARETAAPQGVQQPEEMLIRAEAHRRSLTAFAALPREAQELLYLVVVEGLSYQQVGEWMGISEASVKSRVHRCRIRLRDHAASDRPGAHASQIPRTGNVGD